MSKLTGMNVCNNQISAMLRAVRRLIVDMPVNHYTFILSCMLLFTVTAPDVVVGQIPGVITSEELNLQRLFIEANREKLLGSY